MIPPPPHPLYIHPYTVFQHDTCNLKSCIVYSILVSVRIMVLIVAYCLLFIIFNIYSVNDHTQE